MSDVLGKANEEWRAFIRARPGERFISRYRRSQRDPSVARRVLRVGFGLILTVGGAAMWVLPGPGWACVIVGLGMFASEWRALAR